MTTRRAPAAQRDAGCAEAVPRAAALDGIALSPGAAALEPRRRAALGARQIDAAGGLTVGELARKLAIHVSTASNLVRRLEELGLLTRQRSAHDQRRAGGTPIADMLSGRGEEG